MENKNKIECYYQRRNKFKYQIGTKLQVESKDKHLGVEVKPTFLGWLLHKYVTIWDDDILLKSKKLKENEE